MHVRTSPWIDFPTSPLIQSYLCASCKSFKIWFIALYSNWQNCFSTTSRFLSSCVPDIILPFVWNFTPIWKAGKQERKEVHEKGFFPNKHSWRIENVYVTSKISRITQKNLFSPTSLSVTKLHIGYQITPKKRSKRKKLMTHNTNHPTSPLPFNLLHLPLISPLLSSPNSYKNVGNRSKKAFFNYLPVSNTVTIRLPDKAEISAKKGEKNMKIPKNHMQNKSQILTLTLFTQNAFTCIWVNWLLISL